MNMGYVRFQNTVDDMADCFDHLYDEDLSEPERKARNYFLLMCKQVVDEFPFEIEQAEKEEGV